MFNRKWLIYLFLDARTHKIALESIQKCRSTLKPMRLHAKMDAHACNNACTCTLNTMRLHRIYILQPIRKIDTHSHAGANSCMTHTFIVSLYIRTSFLKCVHANPRIHTNMHFFNSASNCQLAGSFWVVFSRSSE